MQITAWQAVLIGLTYYLGQNGNPVLGVVGSHGWMRPLVCGTVVGAILGQPVQGAIIGAAITIPYLAFISAGGSQPMDPALAGVLGTALGIASGVSPEVAVTLAIPMGLLGTVIWILHMTVDSFFVHWADRAAEQGDIRRMNFIHFWPPQIFVFVISVIPVALAAYFGTPVVSQALSMIQGRPIEVLATIGAVLPALGIGMLLNSMTGKGTLIFFGLGFLIMVYGQLPILGISMFAGIVAWAFTQIFNRDQATVGGAKQS